KRNITRDRRHCRTDTLVEQVTCENKIEVGKIQTGFAGSGFNGDALHTGLRELPGFLAEVRITGDHIERALQRAFAFFLSDDGGMRRDIDRTIEADRAAALSFCHKKIPSCPG